MDKTVYIAGNSNAMRYAAEFLSEAGIRIADRLSSKVDYILLDVPSFNQEGLLRDGSRIELLLADVPAKTVIIGGNLWHPALEKYHTVDLLQDARYLAENAHITAECALDVALPYLDITLRHCPVLVLGWGRIGKCLAKILKALDADVTVAARKEADRAMLQALGFCAADFSQLSDLERYRLIFNTVPHPVIACVQAKACRADCVKIDLASRPGIEDEHVIIARGLPGIHFPESSGRLIAETILRKENLL